MAISTQPHVHPHWTSGRCFAAMDPERQREVVGYVRKGATEATPLLRASVSAPRPASRCWARVQADPESFEGSSSGRWR